MSPVLLNRSRAGRPNQRGVVLIVSLVILVMLTVMVVGMIRLSSTGLVVVGNMQAQKEAEASAQNAIESTLSSVTTFQQAADIGLAGVSATTLQCGVDSGGTAVNWSLQTVDGVANVKVCDITDGYYAVKVILPECIHVEPSPGFGLDEVPGFSPPEDTYWDVKVLAEDTVRGGKAELHQGVKVQRTKGNCP